MKRFIFFLALLLIMTAAASCNLRPVKNQTAPDPPPKATPTPPAAASLRDYFPIGQGSTWSYLGQGNEYASFTREVVFTGNGQAQFKEDNGGTVSSSIFEVSGSQLKRIYFKGESYDTINLLNKGYTSNDNTVFLKEPLQVGTSWSSGKSTRRIVQTAIQVQTPAGTFNDCIMVEIKEANSTGLTSEYYARGVGMVKREFTDKEASISSSLKSYKIAP